MSRRPPALNFTGANWPTPTQVLLLRACLAPDATAITAWRAWQKEVAFDDIDVATQRLVPLLYHNLTQLGVDDPALGRYRGMHRRSWYTNQLFFLRAADILGLFKSAGIPTLVLKGVPLAHLYYPGVALRQMSDLDLLVPRERAGAALGVLVANGWQGYDASGHAVDALPRDFSVGHNRDFENAAGEQVDLHWRALKLSLDPGAEEALWTGAETFPFAHTDARTLNATDHLLHVCLHGLPVNDFPALRWVADAIMILRRRPIDWDRLIAATQVHRAATMMLHALTYLRDNFAAPVPDEVLGRIGALPVEGWEYREFSALTRTDRISWWLRKWVYGYLRYRRTLPAAAARPAASAYLRYWQLRWDLDHVRELPAAAWRRLRA